MSLRRLCRCTFDLTVEMAAAETTRAVGMYNENSESGRQRDRKAQLNYDESCRYERSVPTSVARFNKKLLIERSDKFTKHKKRSSSQ